MAVNDETVRFYDADDQARHGFGDLTGDREQLAALLARTAPRGTEVVPDADASASLQPAQVAAWFLARSYQGLTFGTRLERLGRVRGPVVMRKPGSGESLSPAREALRCPVCGGGLHDEPGTLTCTGGHRFVVEGDVPRLLAAETTPGR